MATLTPEIAKDLMQRSMTTGAPTSEFNKYGGYDAVSSMYNQSGGTYSLADISAADKAKYASTIANTGVGNLALLKETNTPLTEAGRNAMLANGVTTMDAAALTSAGIPFQQTTGEKLTDLSGRFGTLSTQMTALQKAYDDLLAKQSRNTTTGGSTGTVTGGGTIVDTGGVNTGSTGSTGSTGGPATGTTGPVYGPDGRMYSSAAAAIAAGVTNYTLTKPTGVLAGADTMGAGGGGTASRGFTAPNASTGNVNPGGLISGQSQQLFAQGTPTVGYNRSGTTNPFART